MSRSWFSFVALWLHRLGIMLVLVCFANHAYAEDDDDDDDYIALTTGLVGLDPDQEIENLFATMARMSDPDGACPDNSPLLEGPLPAPGSFACGTYLNGGDTVGIWRIDFEAALGAGYVFDVRIHDNDSNLAASAPYTSILTNDTAAGIAARETGGRRMASLPIVLAPGEAMTLRVQIAAPADIEDADPLLRPELDFDRSVRNRAYAFAGLMGASAILIIFYFAFGRLLQSVSARQYAYYFVATVLVAAASEGYLAFLFPGNTLIFTSVINKVLSAGLIFCHLLFVAAFVKDSLPSHPLPKRLQKLGLFAVLALGAAGASAYLSGGVAGWLRYYDQGLELDALIEDFNVPLMIGAAVTLLWIAAICYASVLLIANRTKGAILFALGALILVAALIGNSFAEVFADDLGEDSLWFQYSLLLDGILFAAAIVRQAFGLRAERNAAVAQELAALKEQQRLSATLTRTRDDRDRAKELAEARRSRLALAGHDLQQPLTSLQLAIDEAEGANTGLGDTLRTNLGYLKDLLDTTVADSHPLEDDTVSGTHPPPQSGVEDVPIDVVFANAAQMFKQEAAAKGLSLTYEKTDIVVRAEPIALIRTIANLTSNAVKYTEAGGVTLFARKDDELISVIVQDTGPGLSANEIATITQAYARGPQAENVAGTGLGLSSVKAHADQMGLIFEIQSTPGEGSLFQLSGFAQAD